ncbi:hypothetical protein BKA67DRAFT_657521 [Truncatella angustata]|uniref:mRNA stability protein n=1 Tax=Truncatella angustata TaxID=152316 RepID=A0A9P8UNV0_9PEZI|nr:uncharacterized protein BKA67DRAFT_657521 [Truncatella angustata]KAH6655590.1 hypothetical protein BKA67DRAFT_657521 [Truncatella angustata]KAH8197787.1 hypothetical protein TruAng_008034 [Truncatella angustata]
MNPLLRNKITSAGLTPEAKAAEDRDVTSRYGPNARLKKTQATQVPVRKYFDSADYAVSKAGKGNSIDAGSIGSEHPVPENIPHLASPNGAQSNSGLPLPHHGSISGQSISPIKESSFLQRESSADDAEEKTAGNEDSPAQEEQGIPIRR